MCVSVLSGPPFLGVSSWNRALTTLFTVGWSTSQARNAISRAANRPLLAWRQAWAAVRTADTTIVAVGGERLTSWPQTRRRSGPRGARPSWAARSATRLRSSGSRHSR